MKTAPFVYALVLGAALEARPASVEVILKDAKGAAIEDAVVWAVSKAGPLPLRRREVAVGQKDKTFIPFVTVVQAGQPVQFPNHDPIRHHVYSFSAAKPFEIKLYAGTPVAPIVFDKTGDVVLGCNIHDHMLAYVFVVDTPYFAKSGKEGRARLEGLPAGDYDLHAWHYAQEQAAAAQPVRLRADEAAGAGFTLVLQPVPRGYLVDRHRIGKSLEKSHEEEIWRAAACRQAISPFHR